MPRRSARLVREWSDDRYRVVIFSRNDRATLRVESGWRGDRPGTHSCADLAEAVSLAEGIWLAYQRGEIDAPVVAPRTLVELVDKLCENPEHSAATRRSYRAVWRLFVAQLGRRDPGRIYSLDVRSFLATVDGATRDTYLRTLRAGLRRAVREGWIAEDPTAGLEQTHKHAMGAYLPLAEWDAYLETCTEPHRIRSGFVLETGLRAGELAAARWDWLHGQVGMRAIRVAADERGAGFDTKSGQARAVPLSKRAMEWLRLAHERWGGSGDRFIFSSDGLAALGNLAAETREAVARAGCTATDFHGLRRSAGAMWLESGASLYEVSRLLGHQDLKTTAKWYAGLTDRHLTETIGRIDNARERHAQVPDLRSAHRSAPKGKG